MAHLMYSELAEYWHLLSAPGDYAPEANLIRSAITRNSERDVKQVLELGCGGGNNASHLKRWYDLTLVDLSPEMLEQSKQLNPECRHIQGDMRSLDLGKDFDAVYIHDAIAYMLNERDLAAAFATAHRHCRKDSVCIVLPDEFRETFRSEHSSGGHDSIDGKRGLRYLSWHWDPNPDDCVTQVEYAYIVRDGDQVQHFYDSHTTGLFAKSMWQEVAESVGFSVCFEPYPPSEGRCEMVVCQA